VSAKRGYSLKAKRRPGFITLSREAVGVLMDLPPHLWGTLTRLVNEAEITKGVLRTSIRSLAESMRMSKDTVSRHLKALQAEDLIDWEEGTNQHDPSRITIQDWAWLISLDESAVPNVGTADNLVQDVEEVAVPKVRTPGGPAQHKVRTAGRTADGHSPAETTPLDTRNSSETLEATTGPTSQNQKSGAIEELRVARENDPCPRCGCPVRTKDRLCRRPACGVGTEIREVAANG
jgi:DNA-binding transcriptional MocR family regulator